MSPIKKSKTSTPDTASTSEEKQLAKARRRKSQATQKAEPPATEAQPSPATETAITPAQSAAVTPASGQQEELKTESVQQQSHVQTDLEAARRLGMQLALAERQNDEVAYSAYQQTKEMIEQELGSAPQIFRRYNGFERIDLNEVATEQLGASGFIFSENAGLSALAERLLGPSDAEGTAQPTSASPSSQNAVA